MNVERLLEEINKSFMEAFTSIPEYGTIGFTVHLREQEPVRIEWSGSISHKLPPKGLREEA